MFTHIANETNNLSNSETVYITPATRKQNKIPQ